METSRDAVRRVVTPRDAVAGDNVAWFQADKNFFLRVLHEKVATVITESRGWPLLLPNSGAVIRLSHAKAMHLLVEEYAGAFEC